MKGKYGTVFGRIMANRRLVRIAAAVLAPLCLAAIVLTSALSLRPALTDPADPVPAFCREDHTHTGDCLLPRYGEGIAYASETREDAQPAPEGPVQNGIAPSGFAPFVGITPAGIGDGWDLNNFVTGVAVRDAAGNIVSSGNFLYGDTYTFEISFAERAGAGGQFGYNIFGKLVYQLPNQLQVPFAITDGVIRVSNGTVVGWYTVDTSGRVEVEFGNYDNRGNPSGQNFIDYTDASLTLMIDARFTQGAVPGEVLFGAETSITINRLDHPPASLRVTKRAVFNRTAETIDFEVIVTAVGGPISHIILDDALTLSILSNYAITNPSYFSAYQFRFGAAGALQPITPTWSGNAMWFDFSALGELAMGDTITLSYTLYMKDLLDTLAAQGSIPRLQYSFAVNNNATANGKDVNNSGKDVPPARGSSSTAVSRNFLDKTSATSSSGGENLIVWTATVGDGFMALNGKTITDAMGGGAQAIRGDVQVTAYGPPNASGSFGSPVYTTSITPSSATGPFSYTVPSTPPVYRVVFRYTVAVGTGTFTNRISIDDSSFTASRTISPPVSPTPTGTKTSDWVILPDGTVYGLKYTLTYIVPDGYTGSYFAPGDTLRIQQNGSSEYIGVLAPNQPPEDLTVTLSPPEAGFTWSYYRSGSNSTLWGILFGGATAPNRSAWPYSEAKTITITYTIPLDGPVYTSSGALIPGRTVRDYLEKEPERYILYNRVGYFNNSNSITNFSGAPSTTIDKFPITKTNRVSATDPTVFDYTVVLNTDTVQGLSSSSATPGGPLFVAGQPALFTDVFDPRLEYVTGSFYVVAKSTISSSTQYLYGPYNSDRTDLVQKSIDPATGNPMLRVDFSSGFRTITSWNGNVSNSALSSAASATWFVNRNYIEVHYQLRLKPEYAAGYERFVLRNTATVHPTRDRFRRNGGWSSSSDAEYGLPPVEKTMLTDGSAEVKVEIVVNPAGSKLADGGSLTARDEMNGALAFYLSTIRFQTKTPQGGGWSDTWVDQPANGAPWSIRFIDEQTVEFVFPDARPVKIVYTALVTGERDTPVYFKNEFSVLGYSDFAEEDHYVVQDSAARAAGNRVYLTVFKEDVEDGARLPGAEFELYMALPGNGYYGASGNPTKKITVGGKDFYWVQTKTTGAAPAGEAVFDSNWLTPTHEAVFLLLETAAPNGDGYQIPPAPDDRAFFILHNMSASEKQALDRALGKPAQVVADTLLFTNRKVANIEITKTVEGKPILEWLAENGFTPGEIADILDSMTFSVYTVPEEGEPVHPDNLVLSGLKLNDKGKIVFAPGDLAPGLYAIVEELSGKAAQVFKQAEPVYYDVGVGVIGGTISKANAEGKYSIQWTGGGQRDVELRFSDGCVIAGTKPDGSGQQFCTEIFHTRFPDGSLHYSFCADLGAHQVWGDYVFDMDRAGFSNQEALALIAVLDYINDNIPGGLNSADGRALAQIILWNAILRVHGDAGFAESWPHSGPAHSADAVAVKVSGHGAWYTQGYSDIVEALILSPETYIRIYHDKLASRPENEYVTGLVYVKGDGVGYEAINQQRQFCVLFGKGTVFENRPRQGLKLTKDVEESPWDQGEEFAFTVKFTGPGLSDITVNDKSAGGDRFVTADGGATWTGRLTYGKQSVTFENIPKGTRYEITEAKFFSYDLTDIETGDRTAKIDLDSGTLSGGTITNLLISVAFLNTYVPGGPIFPEVGGVGIKPFLIAAAILGFTLLPGAWIYRNKRKRRALRI